MLWVALHLHAPPSETLEPLAAWLCQFTPRVSLEPPQALLAEMEGSPRYLRGAAPRAALWCARGNGKRLEELSISAMGIETGFLKSIGISTIGELLQLPRDGLAKRCGEQLIRELDQALGAL